MRIKCDSCADPASERGRGAEAGQPYHPVECAVNMLLARAAFDILRSPEVKERLIAHIHRKVNELRFPSYMHGIEVLPRPPATLSPRQHTCDC